MNTPHPSFSMHRLKDFGLSNKMCVWVGVFCWLGGGFPDPDAVVIVRWDSERCRRELVVLSLDWLCSR